MNDLFGFFIWPDGSSTHTNVALLPNSTTAVGIGTVNPLSSAYYISNVRNTSGLSAYKTELDGLTRLLPTVAYNVTAGTVYHLKLMIGGCPWQRFAVRTAY